VVIPTCSPFQLYIENGGGSQIEDAQVYDVTGLIKRFFRELPEPLIPHILQVSSVTRKKLIRDPDQ